jgi:hypothetical protein
MDNGFNAGPAYDEALGPAADVSPLQLQKDRRLKPEALSEMATWSIFGWLRVTGYPRSERDIYRHS